MKTIVTTLLLFTTISVSSLAQDLVDITAEISESIELDENQTIVLATELEKYTISLQMIFDKYEEAEPDPQAMLTDIKNSKGEYEKRLKDGIGKEKFKAYEAFVEKVKLEVLGEAAGLRLLDLQDPLKMTDQQVQEMKPIMAKAMLGMLNTLMKYVDQKMNLRTKLGAANAIKSIKKTMERETAQVLTSEQIKKWEEIREAAKAEQEAQEAK